VRGRIGKRRPPLFALMLGAFITVIVLGICGMGTVFMLATRISSDSNSQSIQIEPPWKGEISPLPAEDGRPYVEIPQSQFDGQFDWRGPVSALLAFSAVLLGAATFFSSRVSRPLSRLTRAARTMAEGDLSVRVGSSTVREIDDLAGAFNSMATSLSDADRQRRQLTADVAHELRTPITIIRGRLEGMQDGIYQATPNEIAALLNETALLERLIEDLRVLALADAGQLPLYKQGIEPGLLLRSVARSFAQQAGSQGVDLQVEELPPLPEVEADPQRIAQVLGNLVANSLRHTPPGGQVRLNAWPGVEGGRKVVCMSVSDSGAGIPAGDLPHIFDRFYRVDHARTRTGGGAGLGLAIAKRMVEAHGGSIWAESSPGVRTAVSFCLPLG
jgi:two-component system OmpR family sensor kinase/two-component system sensor histidine kinase BaeS